MDKHCSLCGKLLRGVGASRQYCSECLKWLKSQREKSSREKQKHESFYSVNAALIKDILDVNQYNEKHHTKLSYGQYKARGYINAGNRRK